MVQTTDSHFVEIPVWVDNRLMDCFPVDIRTVQDYRICQGIIKVQLALNLPFGFPRQIDGSSFGFVEYDHCIWEALTFICLACFAVFTSSNGIQISH